MTIPVDAVREAGLEVGDEFLVFVEPTGDIRLVRQRDPISEFAGTINYPEGYLDALRDEWERDRPIADLWGDGPADADAAS